MTISNDHVVQTIIKLYALLWMNIQKNNNPVCKRTLYNINLQSSCYYNSSLNCKLLAHRITGSGEWTTHQSGRAPASDAEHPLAKPTTNKHCPSPHTMARGWRRGRTEHARTVQDTSVGRSLVWEMANLNSLCWVAVANYIYNSIHLVLVQRTCCNSN